MLHIIPASVLHFCRKCSLPIAQKRHFGALKQLLLPPVKRRAGFCTVTVPVSSVFGSFSFCPEVMIGGKLQRDKVSVS